MKYTNPFVKRKKGKMLEAAIYGRKTEKQYDRGFVMQSGMEEYVSCSTSAAPSSASRAAVTATASASVPVPGAETDPLTSPANSSDDEPSHSVASSLPSAAASPSTPTSSLELHAAAQETGVREEEFSAQSLLDLVRDGRTAPSYNSSCFITHFLHHTGHN